MKYRIVLLLILLGFGSFPVNSQETYKPAPENLAARQSIQLW